MPAGCSIATLSPSCRRPRITRTLWARALAAEDASAVLAADDQPASALEVLESATALHERAGAVHDAERARRRRWKLRARASETPRRHHVSGWSDLTGTERRISALVALGLTNAQVVERLSLSRHSVDFDLRQIFRKLGVSTRVEVARLAIEREACWRGGRPTPSAVASPVRPTCWATTTSSTS